VLTTSEIRAAFPALSRTHDALPVAYFDGPGGTQVPTAVGSAMLDYLYYHNANTHWAYPTSVETDVMLHAAREAAADFLNARPGEVVFGNNMTTITFHVSRALGRQWGAGDEVVVTELDHHANQAPWQALAKERGITVRVARMNPANGTLDWGHLESLVGPRTRLLAIGAASNAIGTINDIPRATAIARAAGALTYVDAVHFAAHGLVDVKAWGCDFLACSSYKFYGPHAGVLFGRAELLDALDVPKLLPAPNESPERVETGTQNHEGIVGIGASIDFIASIGDGASRRARLVSAMAELHRRGDALIAELWRGLAAIPGVTLFGQVPGSGPRTPTLSFVVDGLHPTDVALRLAERGLFVSDGDFYATTVIERLGQAATGVVRAGCACYTTSDEVERLIAGVAALRGVPSPQ
jgi:cysteine desulfurase family protein (TIGR01976 family)